MTHTQSNSVQSNHWINGHGWPSVNQNDEPHTHTHTHTQSTQHIDTISSINNNRINRLLERKHLLVSGLFFWSNERLSFHVRRFHRFDIATLSPCFFVPHLSAWQFTLSANLSNDYIFLVIFHCLHLGRVLGHLRNVVPISSMAIFVTHTHTLTYTPQKASLSQTNFTGTFISIHLALSIHSWFIINGLWWCFKQIVPSEWHMFLYQSIWFVPNIDPIEPSIAQH